MVGKSTKKPKYPIILELNNFDLYGRRFNGYSLQEYINQHPQINLSAKMLVNNKIGDCANVIQILTKQQANYDLINIEETEKKLYIKNQISISEEALVRHPLFQQANILHFHMYHNMHLPIEFLMRIPPEKQIVIEMHDTFWLTDDNIPMLKVFDYADGPNKKSLDAQRKRVLNSVDAHFIAHSPYMIDLINKSSVTKNLDVKLINFGINTNIFKPLNNSDALRQKYGITKNDIVLFCRSQLEFKGTTYILDALKRLPKLKQNIVILTVSAKHILDPVSDRYKILEFGNVSDENKMVELYNLCDIFLSPSTEESFGFMAAEAMSCGKPVIVFNGTALPYTVHAPEIGVSVNRDAQELMNAILNLINNPSERLHRGKLSREFVLKNYNEQRYFNSYIELFKKLATSSPRRVIPNPKDEVPSNLSEFIPFLQNHLSSAQTFDYNNSQIQQRLFNYNQNLYKQSKKIQIHTIFHKTFSKINHICKIHITQINFKRKAHMSIKSKTKQTIKKTLSPATKIVRRIAREIAVEEDYEKLPKIYNLIEELQQDIISLKKTTTVLEQQMPEISDFEAKAQYLYYYHGGSGNHGCEALVRTITELCGIDKNNLGVYSYRPEQDREFGILNFSSFIKKSYLNANEVPQYLSPTTIALSIGGDNYCNYPNPQLANYNRKFHESGAKTALIGCSIDSDVLEHGDVVGDLCQFDLITARESITYNALINKGITKNTKYVPDSAFTLGKEPSGITLPKNTVGINISDITMSIANTLLFENIEELINYILLSTDYRIALIPHVHQDFNDDYNTLKHIYSYFNKTERMQLIDTNFNACQLKDIISQCQLLITARTHCSIAGYSSNVPTLVLGYSTKAKGIARDIFGTEKNYVKPVQELKNKDEIKNAFIWLDKNQASIKKHLETFMSSYIEKAKEIKKHVNNLTYANNITSRFNTANKAQIGQYKKGILSIITSCYNSEKYLYRYLNSILDQTNHHIQLIIVNDGSTDRTEKIIANYKPVLEKQGVELIYISQPNGGIGAAYNTALEYLSGEYFCWCDSDNFYSPNFVDKILSYFKKHPNHKILRHDGFLIPEEEVESLTTIDKENLKKFSTNSPNPDKKNLFMDAILERNWHFGNTVLSTPAFDSVTTRHLYPSREGQNWQLCLPMLYNFDSHYIPDTLFYAVIRKTSVSLQNLQKNNTFLYFDQLDGYKKILQEVLNELNVPNIKYLSELIEQKYIYMKLSYSRDINDQKNIDKYTKLFQEKVAPNNLYQKEIDKILKNTK